LTSDREYVIMTRVYIWREACKQQSSLKCSPAHTS
jgi:hypothetical protein